MGTALREAPGMARRKAPRTAMIRMTDDASQWARIASGYTGESMTEYVSRVISERARQDVERLHGERTKDKPPKR